MISFDINNPPVMKLLPSKNEGVVASFVKTSRLFEYIKDKDAAIQRLNAILYTKDIESRIKTVAGENITFSSMGKDYDDLAVLAHIRQTISLDELVTRLYWKAVSQGYSSAEIQKVLKQKVPLEAIDLFTKEGKINARAEAILKGTMSLNSDGAFTSKQVQGWFDLMRKAPLSEQRFLLGEIYNDRLEKIQEAQESLFPYVSDEAYVKEENIYKGSLTEKASIMDVTYNGGINVFNRVVINKEHWRVYPSIGMVQAVHKMIGSNIRPIFHFGTGESLRENGLKGERDCSVPSTFAKLPEVADRYAAPFEQFLSHDLLYHTFNSASIPPSHQELFIIYGDILAKWGKKSKYPDYYKMLVENFQDMDVSFYRSELALVKSIYPDKTPLKIIEEAAFWWSIGVFIAKTPLFMLKEKILENSTSSLSVGEKRKECGAFRGKLEDAYKESVDAHKDALTTLFINSPKLTASANLSLKGLFEIQTQRSRFHVLLGNLTDLAKGLLKK